YGAGVGEWTVERQLERRGPVRGVTVIGDRSHHRTVALLTGIAQKDVNHLGGGRWVWIHRRQSVEKARPLVVAGENQIVIRLIPGGQGPARPLGQDRRRAATRQHPVVNRVGRVKDVGGALAIEGTVGKDVGAPGNLEIPRDHDGRGGRL